MTFPFKAIWMSCSHWVYSQGSNNRATILSWIVRIDTWLPPLSSLSSSCLSLLFNLDPYNMETTASFSYVVSAIQWLCLDPSRAFVHMLRRPRPQGAALWRAVRICVSGVASSSFVHIIKTCGNDGCPSVHEIDELTHDLDLRAERKAALIDKDVTLPRLYDIW